MIPFLAFLALQADAPAAAIAPARSTDDDRLSSCMALAATSPVDAAATASEWLREAGSSVTGALKVRPLTCLGQTLSIQARYQAAEDAFAEAATLETADAVRKADLWAMAGNAAFADGRAADALAQFDRGLAIGEASDFQKGELKVDRARALVALDRQAEAATALEQAQALVPDDPLVWLLSATLARRMNNLALAQRNIEVAAGLARDEPEIGLEAGVIAMLDGREDAARQSWQSVLRLSPGTPAAATAEGYLAQLGNSADQPGR